MTTKFFISFNPVPIQFHEIFEKEGRRIKAGAVFELNAPENSRDDRLAKKYTKLGTIIPINEEIFKKYTGMRRGEVLEKEKQIRAVLNGKRPEKEATKAGVKKEDK